SYFIFASRRRHTRSKRDWSSDVCSSDLKKSQKKSEKKIKKIIIQATIQNQIMITMKTTPTMPQITMPRIIIINCHKRDSEQFEKYDVRIRFKVRVIYITATVEML